MPPPLRRRLLQLREQGLEALRVAKASVAEAVGAGAAA